jgi:hypothetical protein
MLNDFEETFQVAALRTSPFQYTPLFCAFQCAYRRGYIVKYVFLRCTNFRLCDPQLGRCGKDTGVCRTGKERDHSISKFQKRLKKKAKFLQEMVVNKWDYDKIAVRLECNNFTGGSVYHGRAKSKAHSSHTGAKS